MTRLTRWIDRHLFHTPDHPAEDAEAALRALLLACLAAIILAVAVVIGNVWLAYGGGG